MCCYEQFKKSGGKLDGGLLWKNFLGLDSLQKFTNQIFSRKSLFDKGKKK